MPSSERKLSLLAVAATLALLIVISGCRGFFVNQPNSIAVTQSGGATTLLVAVNSPQQLTATATFNSGTKIVTNQASWSSSSSCATVGNTGVVTAVGPNSNVSITATLDGVQGTISGSTTGGSAQTLVISSVPSGPTFSAGTTAVFTATLNGTNVTATWSSSNSSAATFSGNTATFGAAGSSATITASDTATSSCANGSETITVQ